MKNKFTKNLRLFYFGGDIKFFGLNKNSKMFKLCLNQDLKFKLKSTKKPDNLLIIRLLIGGLDGTRTRDPMRDRHVF